MENPVNQREFTIECPQCQGARKRYGGKCYECGGAGRRFVSRTLKNRYEAQAERRYQEAKRHGYRS